MIRIETRSIDYVPAAERHGHPWHLWPVWFTGGTQLASVATGVIGVALGANLLWTAIAATLGCALGTFFMALHSAQGPQLGLPQMIQSRPQFGYMGALLVWVIALISYVGYNAFNEVLGGDTASRLTGLSARGCGTFFTLVALGISAVGYDLIHRAQRWLAYLMIAVLAMFTAAASVHLPLPSSSWSLRPFPTTAFLTQFFAAAAYQLSGAFYVSDYSRYLPRSAGVRAPFYWTYGGAFAGSLWAMLVGSAAAAAFPGLSVAAALSSAGDAVYPGFGGLLLGVALLGLLTMTSLNYYGASLTLLSVADSFHPVQATRRKRIVAVLLAGVCAHAIARGVSGDFVRGFSDLLAILLCLFTPWTAINLVDFYLIRRTHYSIREIFNPRGLYGRWNWRGLSAYAAGFLAMLPFVNTELYQGPVSRALGGTDVSMPVGLAVAAALYYLSYRSVDLGPEFRAARVADRGLDA
ncbi:MAG: cytosine permease [Proteobacteria bacterium]|nr:cytosine permease [Pseudomonadota bacterium]